MTIFFGNGGKASIESDGYETHRWSMVDRFMVNQSVGIPHHAKA